MSLIINGKEPGSQKFDPRKPWRSERSYIHKPGATPTMIEMGVLKAFTELEAEMKAFVHPKCWKYVRYYRKNPKPPIQGVLGWEFVP
jgi:hypothetical protein